MSRPVLPIGSGHERKRKGDRQARGVWRIMPVSDWCHDRDRTYPYTPIPSHLNHSRAPNAKPKPSDPLASQQRTPEHSDSLASSQLVPDPTLLRPFLFLTSSRFPTSTLIPDPMHPRPLLFLASSRFPTSTPIPDPTPFDLPSSCVSPIPDVSSVS